MKSILKYLSMCLDKNEKLKLFYYLAYFCYYLWTLLHFLVLFFEIQQKYWNMLRTSIDTLWNPTKILEYLPKKAKIQIFMENPDPTFISETRTKGISNRPWSNDYNGIMNQRYKVWTPQERLSDKFTVLEEPKEEQSLTFFFYYYSIILGNVYRLRGLFKSSIKLDIQENIF